MAMPEPTDNIGYGEASEAYWQAGWRGILPLRRGFKKSPPAGYTGYAGVDPSYPDILQWREEYPDGNICLRLPDGVIGIDVDDYGAKTGSATIAEAGKRWGLLPDSLRSTSREGGSGIRLFRVPEGTLLETVITFAELGIGDIEVIQRHHRYVVCWPSIHPEGSQYQWLLPSGYPVDTVPNVDDLPFLPRTWINGLRITPRTWDLSDQRYDVRTAMTSGEPTPDVRHRLSQAVKELNLPGQSRHDTCCRHVLALLRLGKNGASGILQSLELLREVFVSVVTVDNSRTPDEARSEFERMVTNDNAARELAQPGINDWILSMISHSDAALPSVTTPAQTESDTPTEHDYFQQAVAQEALKLRIRDEAKALWNRQRAALMGQQPPSMINMEDFLAVPDPDVNFRITDLMPAGGRVLLAAQYKAGKTSLIANLLRCLVDGDPFLGKFNVETLERILLIDTELDEDMLRRWLRVQGIREKNAVNLISLRGRLSTFNIVDDRTRAQWAQLIGGAQFVILDCLRPCLDAIGLSEDKEAGVFLTAFDALCRETGAPEALVVHHMGHSEERSRGDSRLLDWPDVLWKIVRDTDEEGDNIENGDRFFSAIGRDVNVGESQLLWEPFTRALSISGGNRIDKKARNAIADIVEIMHDPTFMDGVSKNQLVNRLKTYGHGRNVARSAVASAVSDSVLYTVDGPRGAALHHLNPSRR